MGPGAPGNNDWRGPFYVAWLCDVCELTCRERADSLSVVSVVCCNRCLSVVDIVDVRRCVEPYRRHDCTKMCAPLFTLEFQTVAARSAFEKLRAHGPRLSRGNDVRRWL